MLDLVKQETERIDSRFLEPACGNGNFLIEILRRKLDAVASRYTRSQPESERYALTAVSSIYGIDLLEDNIAECRDRLFGLFEERYRASYPKTGKPRCLDTARFLLKKNIICGDALSLKDLDGNPIVFSEWSFARGNLVKRRDYRFQELLDSNQEQEPSLFQPDANEKGFIPTPVHEFPLMPYWELSTHHDKN
jgi:hypothetical protein